MNTYHIYTVHMSPTLNGSFALECFERSNAIEIRNGIMFDFYPGLPHMHNYMQYWILDLVKESLLAEKRFAGKPVLMISKQVARNRRSRSMSPVFHLLCNYTTARFSIANNKIEWLKYTLEGYIVLCSKWQGLWCNITFRKIIAECLCIPLLPMSQLPVNVVP